MLTLAQVLDATPDTLTALLAGVALLVMREFLTGRAYQPLAVSQRQAEQAELQHLFEEGEVPADEYRLERNRLAARLEGEC